MTLRERIEAQTGFEQMVRSDPIELLLAMKHHTLHHEDPREWMPVASGTCRAGFNYKQRNDEELSEFTRCFKVARKIIQSRLRSPILVAKETKDARCACAQVEDNEKGGLDLLLGMNQTKEVGEQLSARSCLESTDLKKLEVI